MDVGTPGTPLGSRQAGRPQAELEERFADALLRFGAPWALHLDREALLRGIRTEADLPGGGGLPEHDDLAVSYNAAVIDLLGLLAAAVSDGEGAGPRKSRRTVLTTRAKAFIEHRLSDSALTPAQVAENCHVSLRYLQEVFAASGHSLAEWIRERRLQRARTDLLTSDRSAAAIGARWGYPNATSFGRAFRARFGQPPSAYRRLRPPAVASAHELKSVRLS